MLFTSTTFLFLFLPITLIFYHLAPNKLKNSFLLLFSLFFYAWGEVQVVFVMLFSITINYYAALIIENKNRKLGLWISILTNIALLAFFKYANFSLDNYNKIISIIGLSNQATINLPNIALPIGISFYTFQTMSYTIDVYRRNIKANKNFIDFATYVSMFPQLIAGPIVRYTDIRKQLSNKNISFYNFSKGTERFILGLAKKMIIANSFAQIADGIFNSPTAELSPQTAWLGAIAYMIQIYFDFSAYSDMAIGLGKMFGFHFLENFNYPYIARSIQDFWRRWHISLSSWFRDYLYISLGGNRKGKIRLYLNLFIVFFITGLWHGASWNFIVWGLFHGFFLILERIFLGNIINRIWRPLSHIYTLLIVLIGWVIFRSESIPDTLVYLKAMFLPSLSSGEGNIYAYIQNEHYYIAILAIIASTPIYNLLRKNLSKLSFNIVNGVIRPTYSAALVILFILTLTYVASDTYNPFIYFRF